MKNIYRITAICSLLIMGIHYSYTQDSKFITTEFHVDGVCSQCKARIENAAYIKGVKFCEWSKKTGMLKVVYNPEKVDIMDIHKRIADAGHSTDKLPADKEAYDKLPKCCAYDSGIYKH